jgi:uncharacterized protein (DUF983 family)
MVRILLPAQSPLTRVMNRAFYFQVPIAALAFLSVFFILPNLKNQARTQSLGQSSLLSKIKRVDFMGSGTLVCSVFCLLLGLEFGTNRSFDSPAVIVLLLGAVFAFVGFIFVEAKISSEPLAPMHIMTNTTLLVAYFCNFFAFASWMAVNFNISLYYQAVEKLSAGGAGIGLLPGVVLCVMGSLFAGLIMQKTGKYYKLTVITYGLMVVGSLIICASTGMMGHSLLGNYVGRSSLVLCSLYLHYGPATGLATLCFGIGENIIRTRPLNLNGLLSGSGTTTTLVALIAVASAEDQAVVIAGTPGNRP